MKIDWKRSIIIYLIIILAAIAFFTIVLPGSGTKPTTIPISQLVTMSQADTVKSITVSSDTLNITGTDGTTYTSTKEAGEPLDQIKGINLTGVTVSITQASGIDWGSILIIVCRCSSSASFSYSSLGRPGALKTRPWASAARAPGSSARTSRPSPSRMWPALKKPSRTCAR